MSRRADGQMGGRAIGGTAVRRYGRNTPGCARLPVCPSARLLATLLILAPSAATTQVPTFRDITGHAFGERITQHYQMVEYLEALAAASPRVTARPRVTFRCAVEKGANGRAEFASRITSSGPVRPNPAQAVTSW